ncbi:MAG: aminoacyl-tRNA hydrolase [Planctomycetes bacterium]|nr:aminoacyl-tRNA hydrolase [Planctomycetota bacterium]
MIRDVPIGGGIAIPGGEINITYARSGGPGGQNVNKVASKAVLRFALRDSRALPEDLKNRLLFKLSGKLTNEGEIVISASEYRDAPKNLEAALSRLEFIIKQALHVPKRRRATRPSRGSVEQRIKSKKARSNVKRTRGMGFEE